MLLFVSIGEFVMANVTMYVEKRPNGRWAVKRPKGERASAVLDSKQEAIARAHEIADGGPVHIEGLGGKWRTEQRQLSKRQ